MNEQNLEKKVEEQNPHRNFPKYTTMLEIGDIIDPEFSTMPELVNRAKNQLYVVISKDYAHGGITALHISSDYNRVHYDELNFRIGNKGHILVTANIFPFCYQRED